MFTDTDEFASLGSNCPREPLSKAVTGKKEQQPQPAATPAHPAPMAGPALRSDGGAESRVTGMEQRAMSKASASLTQGVSYENSGFLTPHIPPTPGAG